MFRFLIVAMMTYLLTSCQQKQIEFTPPNLIIILTDDQGWGDVGFNGCTDIRTPHLDALAASGVVFSQGYVSHPYCSPSRAGLLTGKYQQQFGHENNPGYPEFEDQTPDGLPLNETLLSDILKENGYATAAIGKWHLGDSPEYWPTERGFDHWYGFSGGGNNYWGVSREPIRGVLHNGNPVPQNELTYLTDDFTEASLDFIQDKADTPFLLYLAYNAPHAPIQAPKAYLSTTEYMEDGARSAYAAMIVAVDEGVGKIRAELERLEILENTLIVFLSDNGGHNIGSSCGPYRGWKGMLFEGGIRVPFCLSWPLQLQPMGTYHQSVSALDIVPTFLSAAGIKPDYGDLDGVNLLPYLREEVSGPPHKEMYWRYSNGAGYAVRQGNYKLVSQHLKPLSLFNLEVDPYEQKNLAESNAGKVRELQELYETWNKKNVTPLWEDPHLENVAKQEKARQDAVERASAGERGR